MKLKQHVKRRFESVAALSGEAHTCPTWILYGRIFIRLALWGLVLFLFPPRAGGGTTNSAVPTFRWSATSNRIYVENGGSATLSDIKAALPHAPLDLVDSTNMIWLLRADLRLQSGSALVLHGTAIGGDVNEFRLMSNNSSDPGSCVSITADWGAIDIKSTKITSWDMAVGGPDTEFKTFGRACVRVRSTLASDGITAQESRMDIEDSDIGYLGYEAAESYGLSWKVAGVHPDPASSIFDFVNVYGNIIHSHIHDNYFGVYTFGAYGSQWLNNEVDHNAGYGLDPHDDSDALVIDGNDVHHNGFGNLHNGAGGPRGLHGIIASRRCDHLTITNNRSWANAGNGIMMHRHCSDGLIEGNQLYGNGDSGVSLFDSDRSVVRGNTILSNANAGVRVSVGSADNQILKNEIGFSGTNGIYFFSGTDLPEPDDVDPTLSARPRRNLVSNNSVHDCGAEGLKVTGSDDNQFVGNTFLANSGLCRFQDGDSNVLDGNVIPDDVVLRSVGTPLLATWTTVRNQTHVSVDMDNFSKVSFVDDKGAIFDSPEVDATVTVGPAGSSLTVATQALDSRFTVVTRDLHVILGGNAIVKIAAWNLGRDTSKEWITSTQAADEARQIRYVVGNLSPNQAYTVSKGGLQDGSRPGNGAGKRRRTIATVNTDASGRLSFSDATGSTAPVLYSVAPHN